MIEESSILPLSVSLWLREDVITLVLNKFPMIVMVARKKYCFICVMNKDCLTQSCKIFYRNKKTNSMEFIHYVLRAIQVDVTWSGGTILGENPWNPTIREPVSNTSP